MIKKLFLLLFCFFFTSSAFAATQFYYLRPAGSGSNSGDTGLWNVVPSSDTNAMSASNFNDPKNWSSTDTKNKLDSDDVVYVKGSWSSSYSLTIKNGGITLDFYEPGDYDPETMSTAIDPVFRGTIHIKSNDVTIQDGRFRQAGRSIRADEARTKYQRLKILRNYFNSSVVGQWVNVRFGFVCDSEVAYNRFVGCTQNKCCYSIDCAGTPKGRGFAMSAGSRNKIHHNVIEGGFVGIYLPGSMTWDKNKYDIDYPSSGNYTIDPDVNYVNNEIAYNYVERRCQEGISLDIAGSKGEPWGFSIVERDTVASIKGSVVTLDNRGGEWTGVGNKWSGFYMLAVANRDNVYGNHALINSQSANTFTLSKAIANLKVGDKVVISSVCKNNWVHHNTWGTGGFAGSSMLLEGSAVENLIEKNTFPTADQSEGYGTSIKMLYGWVKSPHSVTGETSSGVTAYNIIRNNTMARILNMAHDKNLYDSENFTIRNNAFYDNVFHVNAKYPRKIVLRRAYAYLNNNKYKDGTPVTVDAADGLSGTRATDPTGFVLNYFENWGKASSLSPPQGVKIGFLIAE